MEKPNQLLGIIRGYESFPENMSPNRLYIDNSQKIPAIKYINDSGESIVLSNSGSISSVVKISDLILELSSRDWNICGRRMIEFEGIKERVRVLNLETSFNPVPLEEALESLKKENFFYLNEDGVNKKNGESLLSKEDLDKTIKDIDSLYEETVNMKTYNKILDNGNGINLGFLNYYNMMSCHDLENDTTIVDLITIAGTSFTNIVNLNDLIDLSQENQEYQLVVGVEYTVSNEVYSEEFTFCPYEIVDGELLSKDLTIKILDYLTADYHDRCLRVFPNSEKVTECIISYCYLCHGKKHF